MAQTGHRSLTVMRDYIREGSLFRANASGEVGLSLDVPQYCPYPTSAIVHCLPTDVGLQLEHRLRTGT